MSPEFQKTNCENCEFVCKLSADIWFRFLGCKHNPYHGKWLAEIEECPKIKVTDRK